MRFFTILLFVIAFVPLSLHAQTEITVYSGFSFVNAQGITAPCLACAGPVVSPGLPIPFFQTRRTLDGGFLIGFKGGYHFNENVEVEGNFSVAPKQKLTTETFFQCPPGIVCPLQRNAAGLAIFPFLNESRNVVSYYYDGDMVYNILLRHVTPFVEAGLGGVSSDSGSGTETDLAFNFGGGAKFPFRRFALRLELNDHVIASHFVSGKTEHDLQVQYGVLFAL